MKTEMICGALTNTLGAPLRKTRCGSIVRKKAGLRGQVAGGRENGKSERDITTFLASRVPLRFAAGVLPLAYSM